MKFFALMLVIVFGLSLCNLASKLHGGKSGNSGSNSSSSSTDSSGGIVAEKGEANAAQLAAISGGQQIKWDAQGMSWTVPPQWSAQTNETKTFAWGSPGGFDAANLIVNISAMDENFPTDVSIKAYYDGAKSRAKNGEVDELKWVEIDGLKGVQFRESNPEKPDDFRRLHWIAYRKFAGQVQMVNLMLSSTGKGFKNHQDAMYGVLYSTKITH